MRLFRIEFIVLFFLVSGCALKAERVNLFFDTKPEVSVCSNVLQKTIGIAPPVDKRPPVERAGDQPHGIFLLLWNQRLGDYITSDKDFLDPTNKSMAEQMGYTLSRTNCFYQTKVLKSEIPFQASPENLLVALANERVDYILTSEVKHFYGKQKQKAYFYMLPAYFVDFYGWANQAENAEGHTEISARLYETNTGQEVWSDRVITDSTNPQKGSYPKAAADSFREACRKIANEIYRFAQISQGSVTIPKPEKR